MASGTKTYEVDFLRWLKDRLKDKGLQPTFCGTQTKVALGENHEIDLSTGFWARPSYSRSTPPRVLYQIDATGAVLTPLREANFSVNLGGINNSQEDKAAAIFRVVPLL